MHAYYIANVLYDIKFLNWFLYFSKRYIIFPKILLLKINLLTWFNDDNRVTVTSWHTKLLIRVCLNCFCRSKCGNSATLILCMYVIFQICESVYYTVIIRLFIFHPMSRLPNYIILRLSPCHWNFYLLKKNRKSISQWLIRKVSILVDYFILYFSVLDFSIWFQILLI